ncbi:MAG: DEAD/DEAH box helicase [Candidatus Thioglobus sp.]|nr:DEAD/DEAH box helicase [Candidatus Thioglobus sp.]
MELRNYQFEALDQVHESINKGNTRIILQAATGSGKTVMASEFVKNAVEAGKEVLFLAHRRELIAQCSSKLYQFGISHGIIMAGQPSSTWLGVQVASVDTLRARAINNTVMDMPKADYVIIDECHRSLSNTYRKIIAHYDKSTVLGLTATPIRGDGLGLGHIYQDMVQAPSIKQLTGHGHLVPARYFAPSIPDLKGVKVQMGDYNSKQLSKKMDTSKLVGDVVNNWLRIAPTKQTVVFASSVKHSIHLMEKFTEAGIKAAHIDGKTDSDERDHILKQLDNKEIQVICNCMVLTEGWDCPSAEVAILARPTKSLGLYLQMVGRVLRPIEGKDEAIIIDHSGAVYEHGFVEDEFEWDLSPEKKIQDSKKKESKEREVKPVTCESCFTVFSGERKCPNCGAILITKGRALIMGDGELGEVNGKSRKAANPKYTEEQKILWYSMLLGYSRKKGYKDGWAYYKYQDKFGVKPSHKKIITEPNKECLSWITHIQIKHAKRKSA